MTELDISALSSNLRSYCDKVADENEAIIVTLEGERKVVLVNFEEILALVHFFESLAFVNVVI